MDVQKQMDYWCSSCDEDIAAARSLFENNHLRHALFFSHPALEKILKAHVSLHTGNVPPRSHNLVRLAELAGLSLSPEHETFLREFDVYQLEGRYPDAAQIPLDSETARQEVDSAEEMIEWMKSLL